MREAKVFYQDFLAGTLTDSMELLEELYSRILEK
jgi:hypothetical protein